MRLARRLRPTGWLGVLSLFVVAMVATLTAIFHYETALNPVTRYNSFPWSAQWIQAPNGPSKLSCFRKSFLLSSAPERAYAIVVASNFYDLRINGFRPTCFFRPSLSKTFRRDSSLYTALGYPRKDELARVYNIARYLVPGRNTIALKVQSDEDTPRLAMEAHIGVPNNVTIGTDATWRWSPGETNTSGLDWFDPRLSDNNWQLAKANSDPIDMDADGDVRVFETSMAGSVITKADAPVDQPTTFRKDFTYNARRSGGWIRVWTDGYYDLRLNGNLLASTSTVAKDPTSALARMLTPDPFPRVQGANFSPQYPRATPPIRVDAYTARNVLHPGRNLIEITVHPRELSTLQAPLRLYADAMFETDSGSPPLMVRTDSSWSAEVGTTRGFADVARNTEQISSRQATLSFRGQLLPQLAMTSLVVKNAVLVFFADLLVCLAVVGLFRRFRSRPWLRTLGLVGAINLPPLLVYGFAWALSTIFVASTQSQYFSQEAFYGGSLQAASLAFVLSLLLFAFPKPLAAAVSSLRPVIRTKVPGVVPYVGLAVILGLAVAFYTRGLTNENYLPDEYVSILAARGIVHTGLPLFENTGILYSRSSLFHYLLALPIAIFGEGNPYATHAVSIFWQLAIVVLGFVWVRQLRGNALALTAAALIAMSPFLIFYAREVRFYSQFTFFTTLALYFAYRCTKVPDRFGYRVGLVLAFSAAYLSQQFALAMIPGIFFALAVGGGLRPWLQRRSIVLLLIPILVMGADAYAYLRYCQTPLPFVDADATPNLAFHFDNLDALPLFLFSGYERSGLALGLLFGAGLAILWFRREARRGMDPLAILYWATIPCLIANTLLAPRPASRYIVQLVPITIMIAVCVLAMLAEEASLVVRRLGAGRSMGTAMAAFSAIAALTLIVAGFRPVRTWNAMQRDLNRDMTEASRYVAGHSSTKDRIVYYSPEVAMVELGRCDYMWRPRRGSIFKYYDKNRILRERNSGAVVIDTAEKLRAVMETSQRVWVVLPTDSLGSGKYSQGDSLSGFILDNFRTAFEPFSAKVLVWDRSWNRYRHRFKETRQDLANFTTS